MLVISFAWCAITFHRVVCLIMFLLIYLGLLHDVGHGPFSHLFEREFLPRVLNGFKWWFYILTEIHLLKTSISSFARIFIKEVNDYFYFRCLKLYWSLFVFGASMVVFIIWWKVWGIAIPEAPFYFRQCMGFSYILMS